MESWEWDYTILGQGREGSLCLYFYFEAQLQLYYYFRFVVVICLINSSYELFTKKLVAVACATLFDCKNFKN